MNTSLLDARIDHESLVISTIDFPQYESTESFILSLCKSINASCKDIERSADLVQARVDYLGEDFLLEINWTSESIWFSALQRDKFESLFTLKQGLLKSVGK